MNRCIADLLSGRASHTTLVLEPFLLYACGAGHSLDHVSQDFTEQKGPRIVVKAWIA